MRSPEGIRHLRLVSTETPPPEPEFNAQDVPKNLTDIASLCDFLISKLETLTKNPETHDQLLLLLDTIKDALDSETIGYQIAEQPISEPAKILSDIFTTLTQTKNNIPGFTELTAHIDMILERVVSKLVVIAERSSRNLYASANPAFHKILQIIQEFPEYIPSINEKMPGSVTTKIFTDLVTRASEQHQIEEIGKKLKSVHSTVELLMRLPAITGKNTYHFNTTLYARAKKSGPDIIKNIISYVYSYPDPQDPHIAAVQKMGGNVFSSSASLLPEFGNFKIADIVLPELQKAKEKYLALIDEQESIELSDCDSWIQLVWYTRETIHPGRRFVFTTREPQSNVDTIHKMSGDEILHIIQNAPSDKALVYKLPSAVTVGHIKPADAFLVDIRTKLEDFLDI